MSGLIRINEDQSWSSAGWVFDHVLRLARRHLPEEGSSRIFELMNEAGNGLDYISLEELSPKEIAIFRNALEAAYAQAKTEGSKSFADPEFYPGFMERFEELLVMLRSRGL